VCNLAEALFRSNLDRAILNSSRLSAPRVNQDFNLACFPCGRRGLKWCGKKIQYKRVCEQKRIRDQKQSISDSRPYAEQLWSIGDAGFGTSLTSCTNLPMGSFAKAKKIRMRRAVEISTGYLRKTAMRLDDFDKAPSSL
jgi:hypothetical protein